MPRTPTSRPSPIRRLAFASLWAFAALAAPHVQAAGKCGISAMTIPVTVTGSRAIAHVQIDGTDVPLMVDSGSFSSFLTEAAAERLHLHTHPAPPEMRVFGVVGKVDTRVTTVQQLKLQDGSLGDVEFIVGGNEVGAGAWGVLGRNLLGSRDMEFDLAHGVIRIVVPGSGCGKTNLAYWAAADTPVSVSDLYNEDEGATPEIMIGVKVNGKDVHAVLDTGAPVTVVSRAIALRAGLTDADMKPAGHAYGMGGGEVSQWTGHFDTVELGAERIRNNTLAIADYDDRTDMLLGLDFFLAHHVYVARSQGRLYFTYNGGPIFLLNTTAKDAAAAPSGAPLQDAAA
ncbi:MAG TPA: retroviral-like aspartic protease family protein, partial [Burkholderiaceae bacterium]